MSDEDTKDSVRLSVGVEDHWRQLDDSMRILDDAQFTRHDVLQVTGLSDAQLKNTLDRDLVQLRSEHNPGSGRRRMFTGSDILKLVVAHTMSGIGFPMKWSYLVADEIERRASSRLLGIALEEDYGFITYPMSNGDWARIAVYNGMKETPNLPTAYQIVEVDRLIDEVLAKLHALVDEVPLPVFTVAEPKPEPSPYSPENDFFRMWDKDEQGRTIRVGLNYEESQDLIQLEEASLSEERRNRDDGARYLELHGRHERARLARCAKDLFKD